jgi:hypothetical protein
MNARSSFRQAAAVTLALTLSGVALPAMARADEHLVDQSQMVNRLLDQAETRNARVALFQKALDTPEAQARARSLGVDPARLHSAVAQLSDAELKDLANRAEHAQDLAAGYYHRDDGYLILGLILVILLVAVLIAASNSGY